MRGTWIAVLLAAALMLAASSGSAAGVAATAQLRPDSGEVLARARSAQARFERTRVRHLPMTTGWGGTECDDRVGRMCWRHGTGGSWTPEPDPPEVVEAREDLLATLVGAAREIPGDRWVLGQRVWYLGEAGRWEEAAALARRCRTPERWWCHALEGLALHASGRFEAAGEVFGRALAAMEPDRAVRWRDPDELLDGEGHDVLEDARDAGREDAFLARLWSYADPLWLVPGNDRLTEHRARRTVALIRAEARNPHGITWGGDLEELLLRYGWEVGWGRLLPPPSSITTRVGTVGHEDPNSRSFVPPGRVLRDPLEEPAEAWVPGLAYARSAYAPAYAPVFLPAPATLSVLPLGDSAAVVASFRIPSDTTRRTREGVRPEGRGGRSGEGPVEAGLFVRTLDGSPVAGSRTVARDSGGLVVTVPAGPFVASVEVRDGVAGVAGRHRVARVADSVLPDVPVLSDLLLLTDDGEPGSLQDALPRLLSAPVAVSGSSIRVAWMVAGLGFREETLTYRLTFTRGEEGFFRRAGEWLGLVEDEGSQRLEWEEPGPASPRPRLRSVAMTLPDVDAGDWILRLELETAGRERMVTERRLEIVPLPEPGGDPPGRR